MEVRVQLRGQTRRKETLVETGYYSWQEKIMNGHSFSSQFLCGHTCQIFVVGNIHQSMVDCFSFHFSREEQGKQKFIDLHRQNIFYVMLLIKTVQTDSSASSHAYHTVWVSLGTHTPWYADSSTSQTMPEVVYKQWAQPGSWLLYETQIWLRGSKFVEQGCETWGRRSLPRGKDYFCCFITVINDSIILI